MTTKTPETAEIARLEQLQSELQQRQREIVEAHYLRHADTVDRVRDAVYRLGELGSPTGILMRAAAEIGQGSTFDRVLISEVRTQSLMPLRIWDRDDAAAAQLALAALRRATPLRLEYPLVEHDVISTGEVQAVDLANAGARAPAQLAAALGWSAYVVAPIIVEGVVIGLLHADRHGGDRPPDALDLELATIACTGLGEVFERAVLRETLQRHRAELESAITWINGRVRGIGPSDAQTVALSPSALGESSGVDTLTPREREILTLMARGQTNAAIAASLVVREGTVKYHVKNVLRKLNARSRADAVAKYMRVTGALPR